MHGVCDSEFSFMYYLWKIKCVRSEVPAIIQLLLSPIDYVDLRMTSRISVLWSTMMNEWMDGIIQLERATRNSTRKSFNMHREEE